MRPATSWQDYELIDATCGNRLERWGSTLLVRPDPQVVWKSPETSPLWAKADAVYHRSERGGGQWEYRRRLLQIRLCVAEMVLLAGAVVMEGVYYFLSGRLFAGMAFHTQGFRPAIALPLVALLFAFLAARAIFHDELLVRSADRIR